MNESKPSLKPFGVISGCPNRNQAVWFVSRNLQTETANLVLVSVQTKFELVWNQTSPTLVAPPVACAACCTTCHPFHLLCYPWPIMFESPVRSSLFPFLDSTRTATGCPSDRFLER